MFHFLSGLAAGCSIVRKMNNGLSIIIVKGHRIPRISASLATILMRLTFCLREESSGNRIILDKEQKIAVTFSFFHNSNAMCRHEDIKEGKKNQKCC